MNIAIGPHNGIKTNHHDQPIILRAFKSIKIRHSKKNNPIKLLNDSDFNMIWNFKFRL